MIPDIAKALNDDALTLQTGGQSGLGDVARVIEKGPQRIFDAASGGLGTA